MNASQSKLMTQLNKERKPQPKTHFDEERLEEIFTTISKIQPKNLMLVEFLTMAIEKNLIKHAPKLSMLTQLYMEIKGKTSIESLEQQNNGKNSLENQQSKFHKKKFLKLLKQLAKKMYPGDPMAYETIIYEKIAGIQHDDHRLKIDDTLRKILTIETINTLKENQRFLQAIFEVYMPQNYNSRMGFCWQEIKLLEKRLPAMCILRFLHEAEVVPQIISSSQFFQLCSKTMPPLNTNHKEVMFYYSETITTYMREYISLPHIRVLQGDVGLNFIEFQILFTKIATEFVKDVKQEFSYNIQKLIGFVNLREVLQDPKSSILKDTKFVQSVKSFLSSDKKAVSKIHIQKPESKKNIEDLFDFNDEQFDSEFKKSQFQLVHLTHAQIDSIRKALDDDLPPLPEKQVIQKENDGFFDVNVKHIVIGQQPPKIQDKNQPKQPKDSKKGKEEELLGYKPETVENNALSTDQFSNMIKRAKKIRINNEFPIILSEILYPNSIPSLTLAPSSEIYLETTYIHLGERLYQQAFVNFRKAKSFMESKSMQGDIFFDLLEAQIFESAGKDQASLIFYNKAKQLAYSLPSSETSLKSTVYVGLGSCLYHLEEYEFSFRCFIKAQTIKGKDLQVESIENAIIQNNIGCCLMMMDWNGEAIKKFQLSERLFDLKAGKLDERTLVVQQNFNKNRKAYVQMMPSFKTMWKAYVNKANVKAAPKVKAKK